MQKSLKTKQIRSINSLVNLDILKNEILKEYGSFYAYAKKFNIFESEISMFMNKKRPITLRQLLKHSGNVNMQVKIALEK